ncbi:hypothetical protein SAMN00120144_3796 [Hymenobacter roseosalivarius DSM 11622]|uniref:DUF3606 domain-containing protein n=1 Tax=Hymenobacter roseosalivarius DSM 11622 TaxID=645990 RepID=A0A1W1UGP8_9BACT|nr:DUF3606 domain-containing protein [Hymenobacter roseosalivarius]SMB80275.1 hypothetical protein SAMN00120144_3796 [Hymenobacter roseosalivarius DSM 11622]
MSLTPPSGLTAWTSSPSSGDPLSRLFNFWTKLLTKANLVSTIEVNYWCQVLNCTETRLRNAVLAVGPQAADVRAYLQR